MKETSASLSCPSSWTLSLSDLEPPRARFMFRKYWPQRCRPASFLSLFSLARRFWNHTWGGVGPSLFKGPKQVYRGADHSHGWKVSWSSGLVTGRFLVGCGDPGTGETGEDVLSKEET